jgi:hypothetical protein
VQGLLDPEDGGIMFHRNVSNCQSTKREDLNLQDENFPERVIWLLDMKFQMAVSIGVTVSVLTYDLVDF